jgi:hypothetical protein
MMVSSRLRKVTGYPEVSLGIAQTLHANAVIVPSKSQTPFPFSSLPTYQTQLHSVLEDDISSVPCEKSLTEF